MIILSNIVALFNNSFMIRNQFDYISTASFMGCTLLKKVDLGQYVNNNFFVIDC